MSTTETAKAETQGEDLNAPEGSEKVEAAMCQLKTYEGCVDRFRNRLAHDMKWEVKTEFDDFEGKIDDGHNELVDKFCRTAYLDEYGPQVDKRPIAEEQFKAIEDNSYKKMLDHYGEEKLTADQKQFYDFLVEVNEDITTPFIKEVEECISGGGKFHVSLKLLISCDYVQACVQKARITDYMQDEFKLAGIN